jgi:hypothetical protein
MNKYCHNSALRSERTNDDDNDVRAEGPALFRDATPNTAASSSAKKGDQTATIHWEGEGIRRSFCHG